MWLPEDSQVDVRERQACDSAVPGHMFMASRGAPDGTELLFHRTDRRQKVLELCAADPDYREMRVILREEWPASWVDNHRDALFEGWKEIYMGLGADGLEELLSLLFTGELLARLTQHDFEVAGIIQVEERGSRLCPCLYYMARSGDNPMKLQLHRVGLDGNGIVA